MTATLGPRHAARAIRMLPRNGTRAGNRRGEGPAWTMLFESSCLSLGHRPRQVSSALEALLHLGGACRAIGVRSVAWAPTLQRADEHIEALGRADSAPQVRAQVLCYPDAVRMPLMGWNCMSSAIPDARRMRGVDHAHRRQPCTVASRVR
jgi:hypothetical protein